MPSFPLLISLCLYLLFPTIQSRVYCDGPIQPSHPSTEYPQALDCGLILAHLPSSPPPGAPNTPTPFSLSLPFQPCARLYHGTCEVRILYDPPPGHALFPATRGVFPATHANLLCLRDAPVVMELYSAMKSAGEQIVRRCVEASARSGGKSFGEVRGVKWGVIVTWRKPRDYAVWHRVDTLRALMRGAWPRLGGSGGTNWGVAILQI